MSWQFFFKLRSRAPIFGYLYNNMNGQDKVQWVCVKGLSCSFLFSLFSCWDELRCFGCGWEGWPWTWLLRLGIWTRNPVLGKIYGRMKKLRYFNSFKLKVEEIPTFMFKIHPETRNGLSFERTSQLMAIANQMSDHPRLVTIAI